MRLIDDTYFIQTKKDLYIAYFPLRRICFYINKTGKEELKELIVNETKDTNYNENIIEYYNLLRTIKPHKPNYINYKISDFNYATIILTNQCNFSCMYCYAKNDRDNVTMTLVQVDQIINFVFQNSTKKVLFSFIGGGEPTMSWELLEYSINKINEQAKIRSFKTKIKLVTNGSLLSEKRIAWIKKNNLLVSISFDILPEIQDSQRNISNASSFNMVDKNLRLLGKEKVSMGIRSTITHRNVDLMTKMVKFVASKYPFIKKLRFEPECNANVQMDDLFKKFVPSFMNARNEAIKNNITLNCSYSINLKKIKHRFCYGELCFTPNGMISGCHRVINFNEPRFKEFSLGSFKDDIEINLNKFNKLNTTNTFENTECNKCFAKYHCAGNCYFESLILTTEQKKNICDNIRTLVKELLIEKINKDENK